MFKKYQKEYGVKISGSVTGDNKSFKSTETSLIKVIGLLNFKRWNALKIAFSCKSNVDFVTKLLDLAEEYPNRRNGKDESVLVKERKRKTKPEILHKQNTEDNSLLPNNIISKNVIEIKQVISVTNGVSNAISTNEPKPVKFSDCRKYHGESTRNDEEIKRKETNENKIFSNEMQPNNPEDKSNHSNKQDSDDVNMRKEICDMCNNSHLQNKCPVISPNYVFVKDAVNYDNWKATYKLLHESHSSTKDGNLSEWEVNKYSYSIKSLPNCLSLEETGSVHGLGIIAKTDLDQFSQFGPLIGDVVKEKDIPEDVDMKYIWEIVGDKGNIYFNTESIIASNWARYLRPAPTKDEKNLSVICNDSKLYFVSVRVIRAGEELLYWQENPFSTSKKKMEKTMCGGCNIVFLHPQYYRIHCSLFHDVRYSLTIKKYHCKVCGEAVLGKENIMRHAAELHKGQGAYQCQFCKKFFLRLHYLEMHRTYGCSANPHRSRPLCDFCGKKFCQPQKLKVHIKRMHGDFSEVLKECQCKKCLKVLGSKAALQRHDREVHQKQKEGLCSYPSCGKSFQNKSNLKIHMLTHSGIKPFRCAAPISMCNAAFTTKQCLQFHYKKVHNYTEEDMPKIERSVDYTFQGYSGKNRGQRIKSKLMASKEQLSEDMEDKTQDSESDNESLDSQSMDDPVAMPASPDQFENMQTPSPNISPPHIEENQLNPSTMNIKVLSKGSKKWIADEPPSICKIPDIYSIERLSKDDFPNISLQENEIYDRNKINTLTEFGRHDASNASLLVEAALDSVCNEPNIDIDVGTTPNCTDSLVHNLYNLTQSENLDVSYSEAPCMNDSRDINLISPSVNDHISVTDDDLRHSDNIGINYSSFHQGDFSPPHTPDAHRSNFVRNYINSLSPQSVSYEHKNTSPVPSPPRYDFGHAVNPDHLSSDDSNGMAVQNLSIHNSKNDIQLDLSVYKTYKLPIQDFRKIKFDNPLDDSDDIDVINQSDLPSSIQDLETDKNMCDIQDHHKYSDDLSLDIRNKFDIDLDIRLKNYENIDIEALRLRSHTYENTELDFRNKSYDFIEAAENRNKQYDFMESDFRLERNFEPLVLNSSELQGLDMSARSFHNYPNINRYHHLYPDVDRVDLRLNYSPPPPAYTHADILRVVSLDLTPPGRHSVDLSLRNHPLHPIASSRLLTDHGLPTNTHRLLDQSRLLTTDLSTTRHLTTDRIISDASSRILTDHTTSRILTNEQLSTNLLNSEQSRLIGDDSRIISDQTRLLDQERLLTEARILAPTTPSDSISPVPAFTGYSVSQNPYHPTPITLRQHVTSPSPTPYHYPTYY